VRVISPRKHLSETSKRGYCDHNINNNNNNNNRPNKNEYYDVPKT